MSLKMKAWNREKHVKKLEIKKMKEEKLLAELEALKEETTIPKRSAKGVGASPVTVSIALAASILDNAQTSELKTYLAGQIARAATIFCVNEVVIYNDSCVEGTAEQFAEILQYLECPQYLRKHLFPFSFHLRFAGLLNPVDAPHHLRKYQDSTYREGIVLDKTNQAKTGSYVDVGLDQPVQIDKVLVPGVRVTVEFLHQSSKTVVVSPQKPFMNDGLYWGYTVRLASSISSAISESPHKNGYDLIIGTSEKGQHYSDIEFPAFSNAIIFFGGLHGLEAAIECDDQVNDKQINELFTYYLNTCPYQGSRTIRTEEAVLITLSCLQEKMFSNI